MADKPMLDHLRRIYYCAPLRVCDIDAADLTASPCPALEQHERTEKAAPPPRGSASSVTIYHRSSGLLKYHRAALIDLRA